MHSSQNEKGGPEPRSTPIAARAGEVLAANAGRLVVDLDEDEMPAVQVVMLPDLFERFSEWLDRDVDAELFKIAGDQDDLPTYCVKFRST